MYTLAARRGAFLLVVILFLVSILLEQAIAGVCPWLGQLGGVRPSVVFLDIPLETPVTIDWLPVGLLFVLFFGLVGGGRGEEKQRGEVRRRGWLILGRWWLLLLFLLIGGALFFFAGDFLPKAVRNGIDSFGVRADLILPYPSGEIVHLHGSMIILVFVVWGWRLLINAAAPRFAAPKRAGTAAMAATGRSVLEKAGAATRASTAPGRGAPARQALLVNPGAAPEVRDDKSVIGAPPMMSAGAETDGPGQRRIVMRIPEPVEMGSRAGRPCVYVSMPHGFERKRNSYPCVVVGAIKPTAGACG